jgi:hypothetical protein
MPTIYKTFPGTAKWVRLKQPNAFGKYTISIYVDAKTRGEIRALGSRLRVNEDEEGFYYTFRRDDMKRMGGKDVHLGPPKVTLHGEEFDGWVGDGSTVDVTIEVYEFNHPEHGSGVGTRLVSVDVKDLVVYEPRALGEPDPEPEPAPVPEKKARKAKEEMPF